MIRYYKCGKCGLNFKEGGMMIRKYMMITGKCPSCFIRLWDGDNNPINRDGSC